MAVGAALLALGAFAQSGQAPKREGVVLTLDGPVTPANAGYLEREISAASTAGKEIILVEIDTPGGLVDAMHTIVKAIRASETPVVTYVYPEGARSASAGLYIMYAAHVSAMAPSTNTGAATPVNLGGDDSEPAPKAPTPDKPAEEPKAAPATPVEPSGAEKAGEAAREGLENVRPSATDQPSGPLSNDDALRAKQINDSVAYIRALAEATGRNADWAEQAVREAVSVSANEALRLGVIDVVATNTDDLLAKIDGRKVKTASGERVLKTKDLALTRVEPTLVERILGFIANP
ncbi:MAG: ATP-dependent Clp protease proteolytic subunit, partial [Parvularculaceae bacterium]|nr:ATP-dependent Clp protease proteolytic subunit [Parvularculaceae bacterium]